MNSPLSIIPYILNFKISRSYCSLYLAAANDSKLEDLINANNYIILKALLMAALLDPRTELRNQIIADMNNGTDGILRKLYALEGKIYVGFMNTEGKLNIFYVADLPETYIAGQPVKVYPLDFDAN